MYRGLAAAIVMVGLAMSGCAGTPQDIYPVTISTLNGYDLQDDPRSAIEYSGNTNIFFGEITGQGSPRRVSQVPYIYTPVKVKVTQVFKGDRAVIGGTVSIRALGGQIGKEKTVSESGPEPAAYQKGMKAYIFTSDFLDAGDGLVAATPNYVYVEDMIGNVYSLRHPEQKAPAASFPMRISEYIDWSRPQSGG